MLWALAVAATIPLAAWGAWHYRAHPASRAIAVVLAALACGVVAFMLALLLIKSNGQPQQVAMKVVIAFVIACIAAFVGAMAAIASRNRDTLAAFAAIGGLICTGAVFYCAAMWWKEHR